MQILLVLSRLLLTVKEGVSLQRLLNEKQTYKLGPFWLTIIIHFSPKIFIPLSCCYLKQHAFHDAKADHTHIKEVKIWK